jgi:hypothetical protein
MRVGRWEIKFLALPVRRKKSVRDGESQRFCRDVLLLPVAKAVVLSRSAIALQAAYRPAPADTLPQ